MAGPQTPSDLPFVVSRVAGLNERQKFANDNGSEFDSLVGFIPQKTGVLQRASGIFPLQNLPGKIILNIFQTLDDRQNVLVQTDQGVYLYSEDELFGRSSGSLTPVTLNEEETMSKAILVHSVVAGVAGGTYTTANVWQQAPLNAILSQLNPDGSAAAFVTALVANQFTLAAGSYRFRGFSLMGDTTTNIRSVARLFNVTSGLAAWNLLFNENGSADVNAAANRNSKSEIFGDIVGLAVPTTFEIQGKAAGAEATNGFGFPMNTVGTFDIIREVYRFLEIIKTA